MIIFSQDPATSSGLVAKDGSEQDRQNGSFEAVK
jgi:hypothetical protein